MHDCCVPYNMNYWNLIRNIVLALCCLIYLDGWGQESRLADQYFENGEYEKAAQLYLKMYSEQNAAEQYFERYIDCLAALERYDDAEQSLRKEIKRKPKAVFNYAKLGDVLKMQNKAEEAESAYSTAIKELPPDRYQINKLANVFLKSMDFELAVQVYDKGGKLVKDPEAFAFNLGDLYRQSGDFKKMTEQYLISLRSDPRRLSTMQMLFQRFLPEEEYGELQAQLFEMLIAYPEKEEVLTEMLAWSFLQQKDYKNALRQTKSLDTKLKEGGARVFNLGITAANERDYDAAIEAFRYITETSGQGSPYYYEAKKNLLKTQREKLVHSQDLKTQDLHILEQDYNIFINENNRSRQVAPLMIELAELQALHLHQLDTAIAILEEVILIPGIHLDVQSQAKMQLGDYYLINGNIWDATLLYSQVDKAYKDDPLGHEARFRNARLSYFKEDFEWAQAQFDVLKASTSKLIANDALDMSVFIMDNLGLDTNEVAMGMYARADLLVYQNKFDDAFKLLNELVDKFPNHTLVDDVLYLKGRIYLNQRNFEKAVQYFEKVVQDFPEDIRADNALFFLGEIYQGPLNDQGKAMAFYEKLFSDYSNSTFAIDARKRYRKIRGDKVQ